MKKIGVILLIVITLVLRTHNIEGKLAFDWDQNRDMEQVTKMLTTGKPALLGPIVKGEAGGFYLGPLYYYILTPLVAISHSNPLALSVVSIGCDVALVIWLYWYLRRKISPVIAFLASLAWAASPLLIRMSMVPWNVSFIPLWTLGFIVASEKLLTEKKYDVLPWLAFLVTVTTSIHVSLWPVAAAGACLIVWYGRHASGKIVLRTFVAGMIPLVPLIVHDLTHQYENMHLLKFFLTQGSHGAATYRDMVGTVLTKYGYTIGRVLTGEPITWLGLGVTVVAIAHSLVVRKGKDITSILIICIILGSLVYYRNTDFAEYYVTATFVPLFILMGYVFNTLYRYIKVVVVMSGVILSIAFLQNGWHERMQPGSPYSLQVKKQLVKDIKSLGYPVEVRRTLPRERDTGFPYLMTSIDLRSDPVASRKVYIYESKNMEIVSPPEARSVIYEKSQGAFKFVVFSN